MQLQLLKINNLKMKIEQSFYVSEQISLPHKYKEWGYTQFQNKTNKATGREWCLGKFPVIINKLLLGR